MEQKRLVVIGSGGVGQVATRIAAQFEDTFSAILLASRTVSKCTSIASAIQKDLGKHIEVAQIDAENIPATIALLRRFRADILLNVALPYQDLALMEACLVAKVHYIDTANYEPPDKAQFEYKWQWAYHQRFLDTGLTAVLGCGFDPGVTGVYSAYALGHHFDNIRHIDIVDCNAGSHNKPFATNFNSEINIREITQKGKYFENGQWIEVDPHSIRRQISYPHIGNQASYLIYHEELESLVKHFGLQRARFWMTFSDNYLRNLQALIETGMTSIKPITYEGKAIVPLQFLNAVLPKVADISAHYSGQTSIGCYFSGTKGNKTKHLYIYNNCSHERAFEQTGAHAVAYTTGVPAALGAKLVAQKIWQKPGVWNVEQLPCDAFMNAIGPLGLPFVCQNIDKPFDALFPQ